ncbi:MAG: hypothetical protein H6888_05135 [Nitratireductor sp.]|nr:hypothetical protein [Nitratireductor sp.]MCC0020441.1 hypothetical protein [Nitratireductor sp.]
MDGAKLEEIDALILAEKRSITREIFAEAWERALEDGIEAEVIARAFIDGALGELARASGDSEALKMIAMIRSMEQGGEFLLDKTIQ